MHGANMKIIYKIISFNASGVGPDDDYFGVAERCCCFLQLPH